MSVISRLNISLFFITFCFFLSSYAQETLVNTSLLKTLGKQKSDKIYIWKEAEEGLNPELKGLLAVEQSDASGGAYITEPDGFVEVFFEIKKAANYYLYGRFFAQDYNNDSFVLACYDSQNDTLFHDVWNNINDDAQMQWAWDVCRFGVENGQALFQIALVPGKYTLKILPRDANEIKMDKFLWTTDEAYQGAAKDGHEYVAVEIEQGQYFPPFSKGSHLCASNDAYIGMEAANATYEFTLDKAGHYKILGYVYGKNPQSDSMFIILDDAPLDIWHFMTNKKWGQWQWSSYTEKKGLFLEAGTHKIQLIQRETDAGLDAILITDDLEIGE